MNDADRVIALVGLMQAVRMVDLIAFGKHVDVDARDHTIRAIYDLDPATIADVMPDPAAYRLGWQVARAMVERPNPEIIASMRYAFGIIDLTNQLARNPSVTARLHAELDVLASAAAIARDAELPEQPEMARIASIYERTIATLGRRLHVSGREDTLTQPDIQAVVRSLLLAGVRFAWLWRQLGGRRWHLLFRRSTIRRQLATLEPVFS